MFVKFEQTNLRAKPEGPVWINPDTYLRLVFFFFILVSFIKLI